MLQPVRTINAVKTIWINARFLARPVTGVERVAREIIHTLATEHLDDCGFWSDASGCYQFKLVAPISMEMQRIFHTENLLFCLVTEEMFNV